MHKNRLISYLVPALLFALTLGGCGEKESTEPVLPMPETSAADMAEPAPQPASATATDVDAGQTMFVMLEDGRIATRTESLAFGPTVISVSNGGDQIHSLKIEGPGVNKELEGTLARGQDQAMSTILQPGTYTLSCPLHPDVESLTVTVGPPA